MVAAQSLAAFDALSQAKRAPSQSQAEFARLGVHGHRDERLGVPSFLWVGAMSPARSKALRRADPIATAKARLKQLAPLYRLSAADVDALEAYDEQQLPNGSHLLRLRQRVEGFEVFRDTVTLLSDRHGELTAVAGHVSSTHRRSAAATKASLAALGFLRDERDAIACALDDHGLPGQSLANSMQRQRSDGAYRFFAAALPARTGVALALSAPPRVKPVWFRQAAGLTPAWYVESQVAAADGERYFAHVISAKDGGVLFRHDLSAHAAYTYRVWADAADLRPLSGPQGNSFHPHPTGVPDGSQPPFVPTARVTLQNLPFSRNDPWLPAGAAATTGNNVEAFADLVSPDGFNSGDVRATTTAAGVFDRSFDVALAPNANVTQVQAAITQAFYTGNWLHDAFYDAGFDELSGNAQADNYGRGGLAGDSLRIDVQDYTGLDNANMATPADGARPRMQLFAFNGVTQPTLLLNGSSKVAAQDAPFGAQIYNVAANIAAVNDAAANGGTASDGCESPAQPIAGKIALVDRGLCSIGMKAQNAQAAGAVGLIVANDTAYGYPSMSGSQSGITIPVVGITRADGDTMRNSLAAGNVFGALSRSTAVRRDGSIDNGVIAHEWGHYISNRLIGDAAGLSNLQGIGMGEGWGDFHSLLLLVTDGADVGGAYSAMGFVVGGQAPNNSYYFGLRRYPYSTDMTKNPLTFRHIQDGVPLPAGIPAMPHGANSEVHNAGEVWASMLWECYAGLLADSSRLSFAQAETRMKAYLVASYKLTPNAPTFVEARDALLAAIGAESAQDFAICAKGFAKRGAGFGAVAPARHAAGNLGVVESYATAGGSLELADATLDDTIGACDIDGVLDSNEAAMLDLSLRNIGFSALTATQVSVSSASPGVLFPAGSKVAVPASQPFESVLARIPVALAPIGGARRIDVSVTWTDPQLAAPQSRTLSFDANIDLAAQISAADDAEAPSPVWTSTLQGTDNPSFAWTRTASTTSGHWFHGPDGDGIALSAWVSPPLQVSPSAPLVVSFRHRHDFEASPATKWDGGVLEISRDNGASWIDVGAAASPTYNGTLSGSANNPLALRKAYGGRNAAYPAMEPVTVNLGTAYAGQTVRLRFAIGSDMAVGGGGWDVDDIAFAGLSNTPFAALTAQRMVCTATGPATGMQVFRSGFE